MARLETIRLHSDIRKEYERLSSVTEHGVPKYNPDYILKCVALKFYKSPKTIENIVFGRTTVPVIQATLFG